MASSLIVLQQAEAVSTEIAKDLEQDLTDNLIPLEIPDQDLDKESGLFAKAVDPVADPVPRRFFRAI